MGYESTNKNVSHPSHYQTASGLEAIDVIEAFTEDLKGIEATDTGNILKYAMRWNSKNGVEDVEKIIWYATHLRDHLNKQIASRAAADFDRIKEVIDSAVGIKDNRQLFINDELDYEEDKNED